MPAETIQLLAREACVDLFWSYGVGLVAAPDAPVDSASTCGIIGFVGPGIQGCIVLSVSSEMLQASYPLDGTPSPDWPGELANQHAGRLKTRLLSYGVELAITTPLVLRGAGIVPLNEMLRRIHFKGPDPAVDGVKLWLDVRLAPDFQLQEPVQAEGVLEEGCSLLFGTPLPA